MTQARASHEGKSLDDRAEYQRTAIQKSPSPTLDEPQSLGEATEDVLTSEKPRNRVTRPNRRRKSPESAFHRFLRERWPEMIMLALLGFVCQQVVPAQPRGGRASLQARSRNERPAATISTGRYSRDETSGTDRSAR